MFSFSFTRFLVMALALAVLPASLRAQEFPNATGAGTLVDKLQIPRAQKAADAAAPQKPAIDNSEGDPKPLGVNLKGLHLISKAPSSKTKTLPKDMSGVLVVDPALHLPAGLADALEREFMGQPLSMALLNRMVKKINKSYQATDFPLVDAYLPQQDITRGHVQVIVREGVLGEVKVEGAKRSNSGYMARQIRVQPGERIDTRQISSDVAWLNENPIRNVNVVYERGKREGTSDLVLQTKENNPVKAYVGYANSGLRATGLNQISGGISLLQLFGTEQSLSYNFTANQELDRLKAHALIWDIPFPWRHRLQLLGVYVDSATQSGQAAGLVGVNGRNRQLTAAYTIPLASAWSKVQHKATVALDYKSSTSDIIFGGSTFSKNTAEIFQFRAGYNITVNDPLGFTRFGISAIYSPGNVLGHNNYAAFDSLRAASQVKYWYAKAELDRLIRLPAGFSALLHTAGQYSDKRLLPTEQMLAGGYQTVRGFNESSARGDRGIIANVELNMPLLHLAKISGKHADNLNTFAFYDFAYLESVGSYASEPNLNLQSTGLGLRYNLGSHLDLRLAYGWTLRKDGLIAAPSGRLHFGMNVKY
ncbi:ShlB/FhaC/HecB family hemolysin secretion/activation protein [Prosthecobacter sp.]|uniref:ShlB/FhaC/HecB family hemolysin secretion/activation protein n=1 Tax=Prosthecobacter sp. TaxID=1965333 RepID=UPI003784DBE7